MAPSVGMISPSTRNATYTFVQLARRSRRDAIGATVDLRDAQINQIHQQPGQARLHNVAINTAERLYAGRGDGCVIQALGHWRISFWGNARRRRCRAAPRGSVGSALRISAKRSPMITHGAWVLPVVMVGMI